jgi:pullulanase
MMKIEGEIMRKKQRFEAYLDDYNLLTIYLSKHFYNGKSDVFYLREKDGILHRLTIKYNENTSNDYSKYIVTNCDFIQIGKYYDVVEEHGLSTPLQIGLIVKKEAFDQEFYYDQDDLGAKVVGDTTTFTLWAPTATAVKINLDDEEDEITLRMRREEKGIYRVKVNANLHLRSYNYFVFVNGEWVESLDPYGKSSFANGTRSIVIDEKATHIDQHNDQLKPLESMTDAIIYETSVHDFTSDKNSNHKHPKTYVGFVERGTTTINKTLTGFDYLLTLGITHVQLMPVFDFATKDEKNVNVFYNWGYDPLQFNTPDGSYATDVIDPTSRIIQLKELVAAHHQQGIRVNMDVVYNHVYDMDYSSFEKIVPYYYFRRSESGAVSNGSFCENDFDSNKLMGRKFIVDSCKMWIKDYGFDGFRFDLMGIIDIETMNTIDKELRKIKPDVMLYGEGWNMPTILDEDLKAKRENQLEMPNIGHFNEFFRDHVKGGTSDDQLHVKGYCTGDANYRDVMKMCLVGNTLGKPFIHLFDEPYKSINYVECHDNHTSWDKINICCKEDQRDVRLRKQKMMIGAIMVAQGVPFLHSGQEFCRTKNGIANSFRSGDNVNKLDWDRKDRYQDVVNYTKDMIQLRKMFPVFRFKTAEEIREHVVFEDLDDHLLLYHLKDVSSYGDYNHIKVFFNPTYEVVYHCLEGYGTLIANEAGLIEKIQVQCVSVNPFTMVVVAQ